MRNLCAVALLLLSLFIIQAFGQSGIAPAGDPVAALQRKLDAGEAVLNFDGGQGYLSSLLENLKIPVSSQSLVFSKSSFQMALISPRAPRAIYFNDDVYVGFVQDGPVLELASIDPKSGPVFYVLEQQKDAPPRLERRTDDCMSCHTSYERDEPIARLFVLSSLPNPDGVAINAAALSTTDQSPLRERWGGWYVTGTHGAQRHLGNIIVRTPVPKGDMKEYIAKMDLSSGANVTDLSSRFDTKPYLTPHSDIAALMVLTHQSHIHNLMTVVNSKVKQDASESAAGLAAEPLVKAMLFAWTPEFTEPMAGTSSFAADFARPGPHDRQGRSLRDLDLKRRLLRYPLSYLIYSKAFDELPASVRQYVYRRIRSVVTNEDQSIDFAHISAEDRKAIREILEETKPEVLKAAP